MLLILAPAGDQTADRFSAAAKAAGVACARPGLWREADASTWAERDGATRVALRVGDVPVRAVLNRGLPLDWDNDDEGFRPPEIYAAWWSALALFPGPVINRPTRSGFMPNVDADRLATAVPGLRRRGLIGPPRDSLDDGPEVNVHRLRDGRFMGRLADPPVLEDDLYIYTPFDPSQTVRILIAGERIFNLSNPSGLLEGKLAEQSAPIVSELRSRQATFSSFTVQWAGDDLYLLEITFYPGLHLYRHLEEAVHRALLDYLA